MNNYIAQNRAKLKEFHYIRKAGTKEFWFDFSYGEFLKYQQKFNEEFCLVLYGSEMKEDSYIIPYKEMSFYFQEEALDGRRRWIGNIKNHVLKISGRGSLDIENYYNALDLLKVESDGEINELLNDALYSPENESKRDTLLKKIKLFNNKYKDIAPYKKRVVSEQVARPGMVTDYLKELNNFTCQICQEKGFVQKKGNPYIEAHHLTELHQLIEGSYCSDNIIIICASCHRKLHYAEVSIQAVNNEIVEITINEKPYRFKRNIVAEELLAE